MAVDDRLEKGLEVIFDHMKKIGLMTPAVEAQKQNIVQGLSEQLKGKLSPDDLKDRTVQMRLMGAIMCKGLNSGGKPGLLDNLGKYFTNALKKNPKHKTNEFEKVMLFTLGLFNTKPKELDNTLNSKLKRKDKAESLLDLAFNSFKDLTLKRTGNKKDKKLDKITSGSRKDNPNDDELTKFLITMFSTDPRIAGGIALTQQSAALGNQTGMRTDRATNVVETSFMVESNTYNAGKIGALESSARTFSSATDLLADIVNGITNQEELNYAMKSPTASDPDPDPNGNPSSTWPPKPKFPGQIT